MNVYKNSIHREGYCEYRNNSLIFYISDEDIIYTCVYIGIKMYLCMYVWMYVGGPPRNQENYDL